MSLSALGSILQDMRLDLSESDKERLDEELENEFGFMGFDYCGELEDNYERDPEGVKEYILSILKKHGRKKEIETEIRAR